MEMQRILWLGWLLAVSSGNSCSSSNSSGFTRSGSWRLEYPPWGEPGSAMEGQTQLYIPIIGPLTGHSCMWSRYMAMRLAVSHLNRRDSTYCPAIASLTHSFEVQYDIQDSQASGEGAILAVIAHMTQDTSVGATPGSADAKVKVVLGPNSSGESKGLHGFLGGAFNIPYLSWAATNPDLSDKGEYGYFWRMVPSDAGSMGLLAEWLRWLYGPGVTNLVVEAIYIQDGSVAQKQFESFKYSAEVQNNIVVNPYPVPSSSSQSGSRMNADAEASARSNLLQIANTQNRLGGIFAQKEEMIGMINLTRELNMDLGEGWLWVGGDGLGQIFSQTAVDDLTKASVQGWVFGVAGISAREWDDFKAAWLAHMCQTLIPEHGFSVCSGVPCNTKAIIPVDVNAGCLNSWLQEAYVSMISLAVVADRLMTSTGKEPAAFTNEDWQTGLHTLEQENFTCMSGTAKLRSQERVMGVDIQQYQGSISSVTIARAEVDGSVYWIEGASVNWGDNRVVTPTSTDGPSADPPSRQPPACDNDAEEFSLEAGECVSCPSGAIAISTGGKPKQCVCNKGKSGVAGGACVDCPAGKYKPDPGAGTCINCTAGTFSLKTGLTSCQQCEVGSYADSPATAECTSCAANHTTSYEGASTISQCVCQLNYYLQAGLCLPCPSNGVTEREGRVGLNECLCRRDKYKPARDATLCLDCPDGMECITTQSDGKIFGSVERGGITPSDYISESQKRVLEPRLKPKYWAGADNTLEVFACADSRRCPGNRLPGEACASTLEKRACATCRVDYSWQENRCVACSPLQSTNIIFPGIPILLSPVMVALLYKMFGDTYDKWNSPMNGVASVMFTLVNHYQIVYILRDADIVYTDTQDTFLASFGFTHDFSTLFNMECKGYQGLFARLTMRAVTPLVLAVVFALTWSISHLGDPRYHMEINRTLNGFFSLILTFFPGIIGGASVLFVCGKNTLENDLRSLVADRSVICYESEWNSMLGIGITSVVLWVVGFGALFIRTVIVAPKWFHDRGAQMRWKFLFIKYRPDVHWWSLMLIGKGLMTNLVFVVFDTGHYQMYSLMLVALFYFCGAVAFMPWRHYLVNYCDLWLHQCLLQICSVLLWLVQKELAETTSRQLRNESWGINFIKAMGWLPLPIGLLVAGHLCWFKYSRCARARRRRQVQKIKATISALKQHSEEEMISFMATLTDWDHLCLDTAMKVFVTDYIGLKMRGGLSVKSSGTNDEQRRHSVNKLLASGTFGTVLSSSAGSQRSSFESAGRTGTGSTRYSYERSSLADQQTVKDDPARDSSIFRKPINPSTKVSV